VKKPLADDKSVLHFIIISLHPHTMALCFKCCLSETGATICMFDKQLESLLNRLIRGKFISHRGAISAGLACRTAIAVPLVLHYITFTKATF